MTRAVLLLVPLSAALGACLDVPSGPAPECTKASDCDTTNGEICDEGTCYGNPPQGMFAMVISPPAERKDLVPREIVMPAIAEDGWIADLALERPSVFSGRVEATCIPPTPCDRGTIGATITITRPSSFKGGPGFKVSADAEDSPDAMGPSFEVALPKTAAYDTQYVVTVIPTGRGDEPQGGSPSAAELYPPIRFALDAKNNSYTKTIMLGAGNLPTIDGTVLGSAGGGLSHYRVVAMGHWEASSPPTEVSSVDYTGSDGKFHIVLAENLVGNVELIARPAASAPAAPTLHQQEVSSTASSIRTLVQPANLGAVKSYAFPIKGVDGSGSITGVRGARVTVRATLGGGTTGQTLATFAADGTADDNGNVSLMLLDGAGITAEYRIEVVPPASSNMGVLFDQELTGAGALLLPTRIAIRGEVTDYLGNPLKDVSVTARPSLRFTWSFADAPQAFVSAIPAATTLTPETGEFALWVDPTIATLWGHYDLAFEPASKARAPSWVKNDIEIPRDTTLSTVSIDQVRLPDAAAIRGNVIDPDGVEVEGAEVKIFRLNASLALCAEVQNAPASCPIPANLQGRGDSDTAGIVRLTLPR
jgi:hypothetical protein